MKTAKPVEGCFLEQHEHPGAERLHPQRSVLRDVIGKVKYLVASRSLRAPDIRCDAMEPAPLRQFHGSPQQCRILQLHVSIDKKHVRRAGASCSSVASHGG